MQALRLPTTALTTVVATLALTPAASAITVVDRHPLNESADLKVRCGAQSSTGVALPVGAQNVRLTSPAVGSVPPNGFGRPGAARIDAVNILAGRVEISGTGINEACSPVVTKFGDSVTQPVGVEGSYETRRDVPLKVSDGGRPTMRPLRLADADWGPRTAWTRLRWSSWGKATAVATGRYAGRQVKVIDRYRIKEVYRSYPVRVTLSKPMRCGPDIDDYRYSRIKTTFLKPTPKVVRRQATPPPAARCLERG